MPSLGHLFSAYKRKALIDGKARPSNELDQAFVDEIRLLQQQNMPPEFDIYAVDAVTRELGDLLDVDSRRAIIDAVHNAILLRPRTIIEWMFYGEVFTQFYEQPRLQDLQMRHTVDVEQDQSVDEIANKDKKTEDMSVDNFVGEDTQSGPVDATVGGGECQIEGQAVDEAVDTANEEKEDGNAKSSNDVSMDEEEQDGSPSALAIPGKWC